jgi:hypothetical protein
MVPCDDDGMGVIRSANGHQAQETPDDGTSRSRLVLATLTGGAVLGAGAVATFMSGNGPGSAALVIGGSAFLLYVFLGDRLASLKVGDIEFRLREAAVHLSRQADALDASGDHGAAERLREEAQNLLLQASPAVRAYEEVRRLRPRGAQRVAELSKLIDAALERAQSGQLSPEAVRLMFASGGDGDRVYALALMQFDPELGDLDSIVDGISQSHSAFEQGQALRAALSQVPRIDRHQRDRLSSAINDQLRSNGHIGHSTDRWALAQQVLGALADSSSAH